MKFMEASKKGKKGKKGKEEEAADAGGDDVKVRSTPRPANSPRTNLSRGTVGGIPGLTATNRRRARFCVCSVCRGARRQ